MTTAHKPTCSSIRTGEHELNPLASSSSAQLNPWTMDHWTTLIHDLRNPLTTVHVYAQLLRGRADGRDTHLIGLDECLRRIQDAAARLGRLVDQLAHDPQRQAGGRADLAPGPTDLVELAQRMADSQTNATDLSRIDVLPSVGELVGYWDRTGLERVFGNLLDNALKYSPANRQVAVRLERDGDWAVIKIADHGIGIPAVDLPSVLERGYRASNAAALASGHGLGLAAVQHVVHANDGTVTIDSEEGVGTSVTVRLPLAPRSLALAAPQSRRECFDS